MNAAIQHLDMPSLLALAAALGWASGFRLYAVVFILGLTGYFGWFVLPSGLQVLAHPAVLVVSGVLFGLEFFADKIPYIDSIWDAVHSVIRIPAGAALAAGALGADSGSMTVIAALLGGGLAATSQAAKTSTRAAINTSPEPFSNVVASLLEDGLAVGALWLAAHHPVVFGVLLLVMLVLMWVLIALMWKFVKNSGVVAEMEIRDVQENFDCQSRRPAAKRRSGEAKPHAMRSMGRRFRWNGGLKCSRKF